MAANVEIGHECVSKDVKEFCRQLINRPLPVEHLWVGSFFELPVMYFLDRITDVDSMAFNTSISVLPSQLDANEQQTTYQSISADNGQNSVDLDTHFATTAEFWPKKKELRLESKGCHPGFTKLIKISDNSNFTRDDLRRDSAHGASYERTLLSKLSILSEVRDESLLSQLLPMLTAPNTLENLGLGDHHFPFFGDLTSDWVDCIYCQVWPEDAKEWGHRVRRYGWPSLDIINSIINDGCLLVCKPHPSHSDDSDFRISFSKAELILIHSWNNIQAHIYHILRLVKCDVAKKCGGKNCELKTYHVKTLMLWSCEEKPPEFWERRNLEASVIALLYTLIEWMSEKVCRNYFIPNNNMWDYLEPERDFENEVNVILRSIENIHEYIERTAHLLDKFTNPQDNGMHLEVPNKLLFIVQMRFYHAHILSPSLPGRQKYVIAHGFEKSDHVCSKFRNLYEGLSKHNSFATQLEEGSRANLVEDILHSIKTSGETSFEGTTELFISFCDNVHEITRKFMNTSTDVHSKSGDGQSVKYPKGDSKIENRRLIVQLLINYLDNSIEDPFSILLYAYAANFRYNAFSDCAEINDNFRQALKLCEEGLRRCGELQNSKTFWLSVISELFPVIITRKWLHLFDKRINDVLASYFNSSSDFENKDFVVHFSPEDFLRYIRIQCMRTLGQPFNEESEIKSLNDSIDLNPAREILLRALNYDWQYRTWFNLCVNENKKDMCFFPSS